MYFLLTFSNFWQFYKKTRSLSGNNSTPFYFETVIKCSYDHFNESYKPVLPLRNKNNYLETE